MQQCTYFLCYFMTEESIHSNLNMFDFSFVYQQEKIHDSFGLKIHNRHKKVDCLTRSCSENEEVYGTASAIKNFSSKYAKYNFNRIMVNFWKDKC